MRAYLGFPSNRTSTRQSSWVSIGKVQASVNHPRLVLPVLYALHGCAGVCGSSLSAKSVNYLQDNSTTSSESRMNFTFDTPSTADGSATFLNYISVVCLQPDLITLDECIVDGLNWERCPNADVAGIFVRVSTYLGNSLLGIVIIYDPEKASDSVWAQLLTIYSLLISGAIAIGIGGLSHFHSLMTAYLVMSPLRYERETKTKTRQGTAPSPGC
ncbi:hypothetical protein B0H11DRAFT_343830 [Mycena galericulata]|nr:hypothetical protein B0H11DRAFT_343830 [Mycena galericulata]